MRVVKLAKTTMDAVRFVAGHAWADIERWRQSERELRQIANVLELAEEYERGELEHGAIANAVWRMWSKSPWAGRFAIDLECPKCGHHMPLQVHVDSRGGVHVTEM